MTNLPIPSHLQGTSVVPLLADPDMEWKSAAFSQFLTGQYSRTTNITDEMMGYAMRTDKYRYVEWYDWNKDEKAKGAFLECELYDQDNDPQENQNLANKAEYKELIKSLSQKLDKGWREAKPKN
jgi:iduronate 2-sulfatase